VADDITHPLDFASRYGWTARTTGYADNSTHVPFPNLQSFILPRVTRTSSAFLV
jgi:hypothetical protein